MKKIVLVRHATATRRSPDEADFERSLRKKGHKQARAMIDWFRTVDETPDLFLSSPANRAIETARLFAKGLGGKPGKIVKDKKLYGTSGSVDFLKILRKLDNKHKSVMVFGHDPAFTDFAQYMVADFAGHLPKCSVFAFTVNRRLWRTIRPGEGHLEYFEWPKGLKTRSRGNRE
jgi:phosphohistidine phosphatase